MNPEETIVEPEFFDRPTREVALGLLGKVLRRQVGGVWLSARIVETEAYEQQDRASHASLGRSPSREPLFMAPGTLYLYHSRGGPSLNVSTQGDGNAVLIKAAHPHIDTRSPTETIALMQRLNPMRSGAARPLHRLCAGQALLCRSLDLDIASWTGRGFDIERFYLADVGTPVERVVRARRLGIREGRDEHLLWRFIDAAYLNACTENPTTKRRWKEGVMWRWLDLREANPR